MKGKNYRKVLGYFDTENKDFDISLATSGRTCICTDFAKLMKRNFSERN